MIIYVFMIMYAHAVAIYVSNCERVRVRDFIATHVYAATYEGSDTRKIAYEISKSFD